MLKKISPLDTNDRKHTNKPILGTYLHIHPLSPASRERSETNKKNTSIPGTGTGYHPLSPDSLKAGACLNDVGESNSSRERVAMVYQRLSVVAVPAVQLDAPAPFAQVVDIPVSFKTRGREALEADRDTHPNTITGGG